MKLLLQIQTEGPEAVVIISSELVGVRRLRMHIDSPFQSPPPFPLFPFSLLPLGRITGRVCSYCLIVFLLDAFF